MEIEKTIESDSMISTNRIKKTGRIIKGVSGLYSVYIDGEIIICQARGLFRKQEISPLVGDFVEVDITDADKKTGYLMKILERKNELIRPKIANVDQALLVFSAVSPDINMEILDKFLILTEEQRLEPIICINKADIDTNNLGLSIKTVYEKIGYRVHVISVENNIGINEFKSRLHNKVSVLAGPSGVGKTSLLNKIFPGLRHETGEISKKIKRGKNTTRYTEFIMLEHGGFIADTPGFTMLELSHINKDELKHYFREFIPHNGKCRFDDCRHLNEPDCIIKNLLGTEINENRYNSYKNFMAY